MRMLIGLLLITTIVVGCSRDTYPLPSAPPGASVRGPTEVGVAAQTVVLYLTPRPNDRIELLAAEPIGVADGAEVRFYLSRPLIREDGSRLIGEQLEPLAGAVIANESETYGPEHSVGIVAEIDAREPGRFELTDVRLHYRLNGGAERVGEGVDVVFTVCADDPAPASCEN